MGADERRPIALLSGDKTTDLRGMLIVAPATINIQGIGGHISSGTESHAGRSERRFQSR
jgi:hypothetical protein